VQGQGKVGLGPTEKILVVLDAQVRIHTALKQDLDAFHGYGFRELLGQHLTGQGVALFALHGPEEIAELTRGNAQVGVVHVAIDNVRDHIARVQNPPPLVGGLSKIQQRGTCVQANAVLGGQPLA